MQKFDDIPLSKHDSDAYKGRMNRLTYSKNMYYIIEQLYEMKEEYINSLSEKELVNSLIREKNNVIDLIIKIIEAEVLETINSDWKFNDENIYNYHVTTGYGQKKEASVENLIEYDVNFNYPLVYFKDLLYCYLHDKSDVENNMQIIEYAKKVEELAKYETAGEVFEHVMTDLLKLSKKIVNN